MSSSAAALALVAIGALIIALVWLVMRMSSELGQLRVDLRGASERLSSLQQAQGDAVQRIGGLSAHSLESFAELRTLSAGLAEAASSTRRGLGEAEKALASLSAQAKAEYDRFSDTSVAIRRLEMIIAGTQSKGAAGESIIDHVFSTLPVEWQVRNFRFEDKHVEFGLRLPNGLIVPIDCKWPATTLVEAFATATDISEQRAIKKQIQDVVLQKAAEVTKYIHPAVTVPFGVAVIPDSVFDLCATVQTEALRSNVVLVSYSMFVPYLLLVFHMSLKSTHSLDLQKLQAFVDTISASAKDIQDEIESRFSRSITMLENSRDAMRAHLGRIQGSVTALAVSHLPAVAPTPRLEQGPPPN